MNPKPTLRALVSAIYALALAGLASSAPAQTSTSTTATTATTADSRAGRAATRHVEDAIGVIKRMRAEAAIDPVIAAARGVYIIPTYGRAALGLGAAGGAGVLLAKRPDGTWSDPAFYNIGGISVGAQAGAEGGPVAMILMNDKAINSFRQRNNFSLSADAGLTVINWTAKAQGTAGTGDVVVWSGTKGLFGNVATIAVNDIRFNQRATRAYYGREVSADEVMDGKAKNPHASELKKALAEVTGAAK